MRQIAVGEDEERTEEGKAEDRLEEEGPFHPPRVEAILKAVRFGDLPPDELKQVQDLVAEFADTFALSVKEVKPVSFIKFRLNIPKDAVLDEFNNAGILRDIRSDEVKAVHPTVLAQKAHSVPGLTMEEIREIGRAHV